MAAKGKPKPRAGRLKVFRTAIGFHDAYVAAPSRKAALAAWGTDKDLFARGVAEEVSDPALMEQPLAEPGAVFRQLRSMPVEDETAPEGKRKRGKADRSDKMRPLPPPPPAHRPSEAEVEEAEQALSAARKQQEAEQRDLEAREKALAKERRTLEARWAKEERHLEDKLAAAQQEYQSRLRDWAKAAGEPQDA